MIETDTSKVGWGAFHQGEATGGCWSPEEQKLHINELELLAVFYALKSFLKREGCIEVLIKSDNIAVMSHINKLGGTRSPRLVADETKNCMVLTEADHSIGSTPPRKGKSDSRFLFQAPEGQDRLDTQWQHFQNYQPAMGFSEGRPLCDKIFNTTGPILQLESRPRGLGDRCIYPALGSLTSFRSPPMVPDLQGVNEDTNGGSHSSVDYPVLESTDVVPSAAVHSNRISDTYFSQTSRSC